MQDLLTSINDLDKAYPDRICRLSGCNVCECRVPLPEEVQIGEAHHVSSWGNPDRATCPLGEIRMGIIMIEMCATCHQEKCVTRHQGEGSLHTGLTKLSC